MDKRDIHGSQEIFDYYYNRIDTCSMSDRQKKLIKRFVEEAQLGKNSTKKVGVRRLAANLASFFRLHDYFKRDFDNLTEKELETFYKDLEKDRIRQLNGNPYKSSSKDELIRNLKRYLKWIWEEDKYRKCAAWMREADIEPEIPAITLEQAQKLSDSMKFPRDKAITLFLFDSGCRIEEALNLRIADIELRRDKQKEEFYLVHIHGTKTKLANRKISIPIATKILTEWLKHHPAITNKDAFLFPATYDALRKVLRVQAKKVIGMVVTPHQMRHSSATYYSKNNKLSWQVFCYRYGWDLNSEVPRRYIDRSHLAEAQEELDNYVRSNKVMELTDEVTNLKSEMRELREIMAQHNLFTFKNEQLEQFEKVAKQHNTDVQGLVNKAAVHYMEFLESKKHLK